MALRTLAIGAVTLVACISFAAVFVYVFQQPRMTPPKSTGQVPLPKARITIASTTLEVELATTPQEQQAGLSNRTQLGEGSGMLFVFDPPKQASFWMKDMRFSIDMVFADAQGVITAVHENVAPDTYPKTYTANTPSRYVLEVPAGYAALRGISVGQKIVVQ